MNDEHLDLDWWIFGGFDANPHHIQDRNAPVNHPTPHPGFAPHPRERRETEVLHGLNFTESLNNSRKGNPVDSVQRVVTQ